MIRSLARLQGYRLHGLDGLLGRPEDWYFDDREWTVCHLVVTTGRWR